MTVDWNQYPPLPEAPVLPEWLDTPEREEFFAELDDPGNLEYCFFILLILGLASTIGGFYFMEWRNASVAGKNFMICGISMLCLHRMIDLCRHYYLKIRFFRQYHSWPFKLKRRDIAKDIGAILEERPAFDETEFRKYWCDDERANVALDLLTITEWCRKPAGKMLYPNDPMIIVWYGQATFSKKKVVEPQDYWYDDIAQQFGDCFEGLGTVDHDTAFAQLVEMCIVSRRRAEEAKTTKLKKR